MRGRLVRRSRGPAHKRLGLFYLARCRSTNTASDIAFIAYFTLIATYSSIVQQLYDYIFWRNLMVEQYYYGKDHADDAEVQYQKGIFGLKLVLSYIRASFLLFLPISSPVTDVSSLRAQPVMRKNSAPFAVFCLQRTRCHQTCPRLIYDGE